MPNQILELSSSFGVCFPVTHRSETAILSCVLLLLVVAVTACRKPPSINGEFKISFLFVDGKVEAAEVMPIRGASGSQTTEHQIVEISTSYIANAVSNSNLRRARGQIQILISGPPPYFVGLEDLSITEPDFSALSAAVDREDIDQIRFLVARYGNVNQKELPSQNTALAIAVAAGRRRSVEALLELGADTNLANHIGTTPLMFAVLIGDERTVQDLLQAGATVTLVDATGRSALSLAKEIHRDDLNALLDKRITR